MLPTSSRPTSLPKRHVNSFVPHVSPFHQVKVFDQNPMARASAPSGGAAQAVDSPPRDFPPVEFSRDSAISGGSAVSVPASHSGEKLRGPMIDRMKLLTALACSAGAMPAYAEDVPESTGPSIIVIGTRDPTKPEKLDHIMPEVDGAKITVTKKTSVTKLDQLPTIVDNNQRALFLRTPGLFVSEQQAPTQFNMSYRGLGNPQEAEFVLLLQDGIPIS